MKAKRTVQVMQGGKLVAMTWDEAKRHAQYTDAAAVHPMPAGKPAESTPRRAAEIWREWHERAAKPVADHTAERAYIEALAGRTGCGVCKDHWRALLKVYAVDTGTPTTYTAATWFLHNMVNSSIGKPWVTWEDAAKRYGWRD